MWMLARGLLPRVELWNDLQRPLALFVAAERLAAAWLSL
jgi:hypothetical protein